MKRYSRLYLEIATMRTNEVLGLELAAKIKRHARWCSVKDQRFIIQGTTHGAYLSAHNCSMTRSISLFPPFPPLYSMSCCTMSHAAVLHLLFLCAP